MSVLKLNQMLAEIRLVDSVNALLQWDQETCMPPSGGGIRSRQLAWLSHHAHSLHVGDSFRKALSSMVDLDSGEVHDCDAETRRMLYLAWRSWKRADSLPPEFVSRMSEHESLTQQAWTRMRPENDFSGFAPLLEEMVTLKRREAEYIGSGDTHYDTLLDGFEPDMTGRRLEEIFSILRRRLVPLIQRIQASPLFDSPDPLSEITYPIPAQRKLCREITTAMGLASDAFRMDQSAHPFTIGIHPGDVRITTRFTEADFRPAFFAAVHEAGHALYEQGLKPLPYGSPLEEAASMGVHESQSRLWENQVGRGRAFWSWCLPRLQSAFAPNLDALDVDRLVRAVNRVRPGLIRVEADEVTYTLHIILRFEIERDLINGAIQVRDLPELWNSLSRKYLGISPPDHRDGVMQDVHWSFGGFGYFPSYALGNMYASAILDSAHDHIPDLDGALAEGRLETLTHWLRENIHSKGSRQFGEALISGLTGVPFSPEPYLKYLEKKYTGIYKL